MRIRWEYRVEAIVVHAYAMRIVRICVVHMHCASCACAYAMRIMRVLDALDKGRISISRAFVAHIVVVSSALRARVAHRLCAVRV